MPYHKKILITGFGHWGKEKENPTQKLIEKLDNKDLYNYKVIGRVLPVSYRRVKEILPDEIINEKPVIVLNLGLAPGYSVISVEKVALNLMSSGPDIEGYKPSDELIDPKGSLAYFSTIPVTKIVKELKKQGIPARVSYFAGTFLCNYVFYNSLNTIKKNNLESLAGFIHIPYSSDIASKKKRPVPSMCMDLLLRAIKVAIKVSLDYLNQSRSRESTSKFLK